MELREALTQIAQIRQQMERGQLFRGYRAATTAFSGLAALVTGLLQPLLVPEGDAGRFVELWAAAAALCMVAVGVEMVVRTRCSQSVVQRQLTMLAVEQFVPSVAAGGLLTYVFYAFLPEQLWMLPGLWMLLFSLGMFASARLLPRAVFAVAGFYLIAGILTLLVTRSPAAAGGMNLRFSPWVMAIPFALGQLATAAILYQKLERRHD
jgi:hypothetical protein